MHRSVHKPVHTSVSGIQGAQWMARAPARSSGGGTGVRPPCGVAGSGPPGDGGSDDCFMRALVVGVAVTAAASHLEEARRKSATLPPSLFLALRRDEAVLLRLVGLGHTPPLRQTV